MKLVEVCEICMAVKAVGQECFCCRARERRRRDAKESRLPVKAPASRARRPPAAQPVRDSERLGRYDALAGLPRADRRRFGRGRTGDSQFAAYETAYEEGLRDR